MFGTGPGGKPPIEGFIAGLADAVQLVRQIVFVAKVLMGIFKFIQGVVESIPGVGLARRAMGALFDSQVDASIASGGVVTGPTRALIGEAGPEAVIPLNSGGSEVIANAAARMGASMGGGSAAAAAGGAGGVMTEAIKQAIVEGFKESANGSGQTT